MARKNFATMDKHRTDGAQSALARRFDHSRVVPFQAELSKLAQNPRNPRYADDPEVQELAASLKAVGQLQTAVVLTRDTFLEAYPDDEGKVPETAEWVTFMGNRRLAGAQLAGWATLEVVLARDVTDAQAIEDRVIHENIHRKDLPPLLEADLYLRKMDREGLSARELADVIGKSHTYVNQRLALRNLIPEFQAKLKAGELGLKDARRIAPLKVSEQQALLNSWPSMSKLVPGYQALFHDGALSTSDVEHLAALSPAEQRAKLAETTRGGNPVSTPDDHDAPENPRDEAVESQADEPEQDDTAARSAGFEQLASELAGVFDTRVKVELGKRKGRIVVEFSTADELDRIVERMRTR